MPIVNRMAELHDEITKWRREYHTNPELMYDVHETAASVAGKLKEFGLDEIVTGIGKTGVVGVIRGKSNNSGKVIGLRADMDALPIEEATGLPHASKNQGKMHACGHDGHTAMLLGAARYLSETRNFDGTVIVIFQPAEEGGAGGKAMVDDGMMEKFGIQEVYGMHNMPGMEVGEFAIRPGALMASTDEFDIIIEGKGSHAAMPHQGIDPIVIGAQVVMALQTIVSRATDPLESLVISVTKMQAGNAYNVVPNTATLSGTVRTLNAEVRKAAEQQIRQVCEGICQAHGAIAKIKYSNNYPVTSNHPAQTDKAIAIARLVAGDSRVETNVAPTMGGEDFSYMLEARPGAFIFTGNGNTANLHHPEYDFNDEAIPHGCSYWAKLAETLMPAG
ncbi:MAG: amidohydrolase [Rhizobiaceae bacterium]|nr:amidohydrolase [Rhizobiaceae bacterium]